MSPGISPEISLLSSSPGFSPVHHAFMAMSFTISSSWVDGEMMVILHHQIMNFTTVNRWFFRMVGRRYGWFTLRLTTGINGILAVMDIPWRPNTNQSLRGEDQDINESGIRHPWTFHCTKRETLWIWTGFLKLKRFNISELWSIAPWSFTITSG